MLGHAYSRYFYGCDSRIRYAVRIIYNVFTRNQTSVIAKVEQSQEAHNSPVVLQNHQAMEVKEETKQESATIRRPSVVTDRHLAKAEIGQSKTTVDQVETDVDEYLRIQQARIDNYLAMQVAEFQNFQLTLQCHS